MAPYTILNNWRRNGFTNITRLTTSSSRLEILLKPSDFMPPPSAGRSTTRVRNMRESEGTTVNSVGYIKPSS